jgi:hypothetical protein
VTAVLSLMDRLHTQYGNSMCPDRDIKDMSKIVTKQKYLNFDRRKLCGNKQ